MDHTKPHQPRASGSTSEMAQDDDNKAISTVRAVLSGEVAAETASFMIDASRQLYPHAMRVDPNTPAATSLKEYHFTILMRQAFDAFAEGRGEDFSDMRVALHDLLQEEAKHKTLAERLCRLMGLWLQDAHNKRQQEKSEWEQQLSRQLAERKMKMEQEKGMKKAENKKSVGTNVRVHDKNRPDSSKNGSASPNANKKNQVVLDEARASPVRVPAKNVFDLAGDRRH